MEFWGGCVESGWMLVVLKPDCCCERDDGAGGGLTVARRERVGVGELMMGKRALVCI